MSRSFHAMPNATQTETGIAGSTWSLRTPGWPSWILKKAAIAARLNSYQSSLRKIAVGPVLEARSSYTVSTELGNAPE